MGTIVSPTLNGNTMGGAAGQGGDGWPGKGRGSAGTGQSGILWRGGTSLLIDTAAGVGVFPLRLYYTKTPDSQRSIRITQLQFTVE